MKSILEAPFITKYVEIIDKMYNLGWDERNAGNVSYIILEEELKSYLDLSNSLEKIDLEIDAKILEGKYLLITGSGKYFRNVKHDPEDACAIIRIEKGGKKATKVWGLSNGGRLTSELNSHLLAQISRYEIDKNQRVIIHTHATYLNMVSAVSNLNEKELSLNLWKLNTENIIIFPDGIGIIPWEIPGNSIIGNNTASKFKDFKVVLWPLHGVVACGNDLDETFGLIETIEKAAMMYIHIDNFKIKKLISEKDLIELCKAFGVTPNKNFI